MGSKSAGMLKRANQAVRWLWTLIAIAMGVVLFFGVDKIRVLWWDAPSLSLWMDDPFRVVGMHAYRLLLGALYLYALLALVPHSAKPGTWKQLGFRTGKFMSWPARMLNRLGDPLLAKIRVGETSDGRNLAGKAILAIGVLASVGLPGVWCMVGVTLTMAGVWLVLSDPIDGSERIPEERRAATAVGGRGLLLFVFSAVFGIVLWFVVESPKTVLTHRLFTLWACAHLWLTWLCLAAYVDSIVERTVTRVALGLGVLVLLVVVQTHEVRLGEGVCEVKLPADDCVALGADCVWMDEALTRVQNMPDPEGPVLLVAASGGGTRAALHATLVFEALERTPSTGPIGEWDEISEGALSEQVLAISSVSGGSVASAHWVTGSKSMPDWCAGEMTGGVVPRECTLRNTIDVELDVELAAEHAFLCAEIEKDSDRYRTLCDMDTTAGWQPDNDWPHRSRRFDDLSTDFTAPLVQGVLLPGIERGESMSAFWESHFDWTRGPEDPLLLVNVTEVLSGARIVSGHPPLPRALLSEGGLGEARSVSSLSDHFCL